MLTRRDALGATGVAIAGAVSGCLDAIPFVGDEPLAFDASPARVPETALQDTGYEEQGVEEMVVERTFEAGGQTQDVSVTNWRAAYDKSIDLGELGLPIDGRYRAGIFTVLSTPQVNVLGKTFNPIADMEAAALANTIQDRYDGMGDIQQVGEDSATVGGVSTTVGEFEAEAELVAGGATVDLTLHIAEAVEAGEDLLVAVGGYPRALQDREAPHLFTLMEAVEHEG